MIKEIRFGLLFLGGILLAAVLSWISSGFGSLQGFWGFSVLVVLSGAASLLVWNWLQGEVPPAWLGWVLVGAIVLRLLAGIAWYVLLPEYGYDNPVNNAGYVMSDAYERDEVAWRFGVSERPLYDAFTDRWAVDQYGGFLFLSAAIYRFIGGGQHQPLMVVVVTAFVSGMAALFTWALAKRLWDRRIAAISAIAIAVYPEAVLLGGSQMREAFTVTLAAMALYGLIRYIKDRELTGVFWVGSALVLSLPLSYLFALTLAGVLLLVAIGYGRWAILREWRFWLGILLVIGLGLIFLWLFGERLYPGFANNNPLILLRDWIVAAGKWQEYLSGSLSGWMSKTFESTPEWSHRWILLGYGIVRPFLPAAVVDRSNTLWWAIAIWRSIGWTLLLPFLVYAPIRAIQVRDKRRLASMISLTVWFVILLASYRSGGDMWDNPRYRLSFASLQIMIAAWVLVGQIRQPDPWFRRVVILAASMFLWFIPWYARRYFPFDWYVVDLFRTLGLGIATGIIMGIWDWARTNDRSVRTARSQPGGSGSN